MKCVDRVCGNDQHSYREHSQCSASIYLFVIISTPSAFTPVPFTFPFAKMVYTDPAEREILLRVSMEGIPSPLPASFTFIVYTPALMLAKADLLLLATLSA